MLRAQLSEQEMGAIALVALSMLCAITLVVTTGVVYLLLRTVWRWLRSGAWRKDLWR